MVDYREIIRLGSDPHYSRRQIEAIVHSSHHTIESVLKAAKEKHIAWPLDESITNQELQALLFPEKYASVSIYTEPNYSYIHGELARHGVNLRLLHEEYCAKCYEYGKTPYRYTQFCEKYRRWAKITKATMRIQHKPGDVMEVDWAGGTLIIYDPVTGEERKGYLFVAVLPCSFYTYAELCEDMQQENRLLCHVHAYSYFGGSTRLLHPDNLKTGVTVNTRYDTVLNRSYQELAEYYNTAIVPCRVEAPKDKSHAEGSVRFAETWILASLRDRRFFSFDEAKKAVKEKLEVLNLREISGRKGWNRKASFGSEEKTYLRPLPEKPFEPAVWTAEIRVNFEYLVSDGINKYSVPFDLIGEKVVLRITKNTVEIFYHGDRVASHVRIPVAMQHPIVKPEHMPEEHRQYLKYNVDDFTVWGNSVGPNTSKVVQYFLTKDKEPEQGYKYCASLTKLAQKYSPKRLESACEKILRIVGKPDIRTLSSMLKNGQDKSIQSEVVVKSTESHGITRGADYYRNLKGGESK
jgi:transposase